MCGYKSRTSARKVIDEMVEKGYIVKNGKGASVRYSICGEKVVKKVTIYWSFYKKVVIYWSISNTFVRCGGMRTVANLLGFQ